MKTLVMGAGAVGSYYGAMLARAGHPVTLVGRPRLVDAVARNGLTLETANFIEQVPLRATLSPEAAAEAQVILFCVKSSDTESAGADLAPFISKDATVLSLQNGIDNADRLEQVLGRPVIPTIVYVAVEMADPGHVRHHGRGDLVLGASANSEAIATLFSQAGVPTTVSGDVVPALWEKLIINCAYNALSAIPHRRYGELSQFPGVSDVMRVVIDECLAVAKAAGVTIQGDLDAAVRQIAVSMSMQYSSTAQDLAAGKKSEIDHLNGYVVRTGKKLNVPTPVNHTLHTLVRLME